MVWVLSVTVIVLITVGSSPARVTVQAGLAAVARLEELSGSGPATCGTPAAVVVSEAFDFHAYGAAVFAHFIDQRYGRAAVRRIWEEHRDRRSAGLDNFDTALRAFTAGLDGAAASGLEDAVSEMAVWSWFVGARYRPGYFSEGDKYEGPPALSVRLSSRRAFSDSGRVDHMASRYLRFDPRLLPGGLVIRTGLARSRWRSQVLLIDGPEVEVRDLSRQGGGLIRGWDAYDEVVFVLTNVDLVGLGYEYDVHVEYDPELREGRLPAAMSLSAGSPNPFHLGYDGGTRIGFELSRPSSRTRLSVFDVAGTLVRSFDLGPRSPRRHSVLWDGTNQRGEAVGSGVYYVVLEAAGGSRRRALAVIRDR